MDRRRDRIRCWFVRLFGGGRGGSDTVSKCLPPSAEIDERTLEQGLRQVEMLRQSGRTLEGGTLLDLGTCWQPTIPLVFFLAGCDDLVLVDRERVLDAELLTRTAMNLRSFSAEIAERLGLEERDVRQRLRPPENATFFGVLRHFKMQYLAPCDLLETNLPAGSVDLVTSRALLHRYSERYVKALLPVVADMLKRDGLMCHCIDQTDRIDYVRLLKGAGYEIMIEEFNPVLRVVPEDKDLADDPSLLNSFLVAAPTRADESMARH
jgi:hypothetical protein